MSRFRAAHVPARLFWSHRDETGRDVLEQGQGPIQAARVIFYRLGDRSRPFAPDDQIIAASGPREADRDAASIAFRHAALNQTLLLEATHER